MHLHRAGVKGSSKFHAFAVCHTAPYRFENTKIVAAAGARPLIFGMSAAPVTSGKQKQQSYVALRKNIQQLEANMDARIVTVVNRAALEEVSPPPALTLVRYPPLALTSSVEQLHDRLERAQLRVHLAAAVAQ